MDHSALVYPSPVGLRDLCHIPSARGPYPVLIAPQGAALAMWSLWRAPWRRAFVIGDSNTARIYGAGLRDALDVVAESVVMLDFPAGERHKTRATKTALEDALLDAGIERGDVIVAVGGGVTLDVVGFVAATVLRGVDWIAVATTLLAQVDAAIGGKTGLNTVHGKNMIGAFYPPRGVVLDVASLATLPPDELLEGISETVKHAVVADPFLFAALERWMEEEDGTPPVDLIGHSALVKAGVVGDDEREAGRRAILNFGHTVGHGIERATNYDVSHGNAVAVGMLVEAAVAEERVGLPPEASGRLRNLLGGLGLPCVPQCTFEMVAPYLQRDKKNRNGVVHCVLPKEIGEMAHDDDGWTWAVSMDEVRSAWERVAGAGRA